MAIDIVKANIFACVILVVSAIVFLVPFFWIWKDRKTVSELLGGFGDWSIAFPSCSCGHCRSRTDTWSYMVFLCEKRLEEHQFWCDVEAADTLLSLRRADAHPRLYGWSHDALHHPRHHSCCPCPFRWESALTYLGSLFHFCSRWRHLDDLAAFERESREPCIGPSFRGWFLYH